MANANKLNKANLVDIIHAKMLANGAEITKKEVGTLFSSYIENIVLAVVRGERVVFTNFGSFVIGTNAERNGTNPQTKQPMFIPAKNVVKYSVGKAISDSIEAMPILEHAKRPKVKADGSAETEDEMEVEVA